MSIALSSSATNRSIIARGIQTFPDPENMGRMERIEYELIQKSKEAKERAEQYEASVLAALRLKHEADEAIRRANHALKELYSNGGKKYPTGSIDEIISRISAATGISKQSIIGPSRIRDVVFARMAVCYWARRSTGLSLPQIARKLGGRDHTSILHSIRSYPKRRAAQGRTLKEVK